MATGPVIQLDNLERQWVKKALETLKATLVRSRLKEMSGSDIHTLRGKEIETINNLIQRVA